MSSKELEEAERLMAMTKEERRALFISNVQRSKDQSMENFQKFLEIEAKNRGVSIDDLLAEYAAKPKPPSDERHQRQAELAESKLDLALSFLDETNISKIQDKDFKRNLIESKILVDRWNKVTEIFIVSPSDADRFLELDDVRIDSENKNLLGRLWGATVIKSDKIPANTIVAVDNFDFEEEIIASSVNEEIEDKRWQSVGKVYW